MDSLLDRSLKSGPYGPLFNAAKVALGLANSTLAHLMISEVRNKLGCVAGELEISAMIKSD